MKWKKLGRVFVADKSQPWMQSHAFAPTPWKLNDDMIRVFVAFWDAEKVGRLGYVDVSAKDPTKVLEVSQKPVLDVGRAGTFDDSGITPASLVRMPNGSLRLYYVGWQKGVQVRYYLFSGVAESTDGGKTFKRVQETPVLDRAPGEIYIRTAPYVLKEANGFRVWYLGGNEWVTAGEKQIPTYDLKVSFSSDGLSWSQGKLVMEADRSKKEIGFGRPWLVQKPSGFQMYYSIRREDGYRLGYAESVDGVSWTRKDDQIGLGVSASGWDSEMVCFTALATTRDGSTVMFYNGNNYGETGFGAAVLEP